MFNDAFVVATKKKTLIPGKNRYIVDQAFTWKDVAIVDIKDIDVPNAIKVLRYPDTFSLSCENPEDKRTILTQMKKHTEELNNKKKMGSTDVLNVENDPSPTDAVPRRKEEKLMKIPDRELYFLHELPDELDVLISYREFEHAVVEIEKGILDMFYIISIANQLFLAYPDRLTREKEEINIRVQKLANLISLQLANPDMHRNQVKSNIQKLLRLGLGEQARDIFLTARTMTIRHRIRYSSFYMCTHLKTTEIRWRCFFVYFRPLGNCFQVTTQYM
jgi:hypothetical protein